MIKQGKNILVVAVSLTIAGQFAFLNAGSYTPCIERPTVVKPAYERPNFPRPDFAKPAYEKQKIEKPVIYKDDFERPKIERPMFIKPKFQDCAEIKAIQAKKASEFVPSSTRTNAQVEVSHQGTVANRNATSQNVNNSLFFYQPPVKQEVVNNERSEDDECCGGNLNLKKEKFTDQNLVVLPRRVLIK